MGLFGTLMVSILISISSFGKVFVISDIDDTIKQSNSASTLGQVYHFYTMKSYPMMTLIYQDIYRFHSESEEVEFSYVSAAFDFFYDQDRWLKDNGFPRGRSFLRQRIGERTFEHKYENITKILKNYGAGDYVYFFGDNSAYDRDVYEKVVQDLGIDSYSIFIRDVTTEDYLLPIFLDGESPQDHFFFSEFELVNRLSFLSDNARSSIRKLYSKEELVPHYTKLTLARQLGKRGLCAAPSRKKRVSCYQANVIFDEYYGK